MFIKRRQRTKDSEKIDKDTYVLVRKKYKKVSGKRLETLTKKMEKKREKSTPYLGDKDVQVTVHQLKKREHFKEDKPKILFIHKRKRLWVVELNNRLQYLHTTVFKRACIPPGSRKKEKPPKYDKHEREIWFD